MSTIRSDVKHAGPSAAIAGGRSGRIRLGVVWSGVEAWGAQLINLAVFVLLARILRPADFGIIALAAVFTSLIKSFVDQGLSTAIVQRRELAPAHLDAAFWISAGIGALCTVLALGTASLMASVFREPRLTEIIQWLSPLFVIDALGTVQQGLLRRRLAFRLLAGRGVASSALGGIVAVVLAVKGWGVMSIVGQQIATAIVSLVFVWAAVAWRPRLAFSSAPSRELLTFGYQILGIRFLTFATRRADDLLIGFFLGSTALGYYSVAYKVLKVLLDGLAVVISKVALPVLSELQLDLARFRDAFGRMVGVVGLIAFPCFVGLGMLASDLVPLLFGETWTPSIPVMRVLAIAGLTQCLQVIFQQGFIAYGRTAWMLRLSLSSTVLLVIAFVFAAKVGIIFVAIALTGIGLVFLPIQIAALSNMIGFALRDLVSSLKPTLIGLSAMIPALAICVWSTESLPRVARVVIGVLVGIFSYTLAAAGSKPVGWSLYPFGGSRATGSKA